MFSISESVRVRKLKIGVSNVYTAVLFLLHLWFDPSRDAHFYKDILFLVLIETILLDCKGRFSIFWTFSFQLTFSWILWRLITFSCVGVSFLKRKRNGVEEWSTDRPTKGQTARRTDALPICKYIVHYEDGFVTPITIELVVVSYIVLIITVIVCIVVLVLPSSSSSSSSS